MFWSLVLFLCLTDFNNMSRVILCLEVKELGSLYIQIYICVCVCMCVCVVVSEVLFFCT